jgi:hypothetical protein
MSKKIMSMLLTLLFTFPLGTLLLCLRVITVNAALVTSDNLEQENLLVRIVGGDLTKIFIGFDTLLLLISCQK